MNCNLYKVKFIRIDIIRIEITQNEIIRNETELTQIAIEYLYILIDKKFDK